MKDWGATLMWMVVAMTATGQITFEMSDDDLKTVLTVFVSALAGFGVLGLKFFYIWKTGHWPNEKSKRDKAKCDKDNQD